MKLVRYQASTGKILRYTQTDQWDNIPPSWIDGSQTDQDIATLEVPDDVFVDIATVYVKNGTVVSRPVFAPTVPKASIPADGISVFEVKDIPGPCDVRLFGSLTDQWQETSGAVSLTTNLAGEYKLYIDAFPFQRVEISFNAS
jgi:hypothetical protein